MSDEEDAEWAQKELDERRGREDVLFEQCRILTAEKKLTDAEFRIEFLRFTQEMKDASRK